MTDELPGVERVAMKRAKRAYLEANPLGWTECFEPGWCAARDYYRNADDLEITERTIDRLREAEERERVLRAERDFYRFDSMVALTEQVEMLRDALAELVRLRDLKKTDPAQYYEEHAAGAKATAWCVARKALNRPDPSR
jgi:hypothetical protein